MVLIKIKINSDNVNNICFSVIIVVFDLSNIFSLAHTKIWLKEALAANSNSEPLLFMVGTKKDLVVSYIFVICNFFYLNMKILVICNF